MITQWRSGETVVGRLRIEGARVDPTIAQLRLSALLNNAISHPAALPPAAIVLIRTLSDPLPRSLRLQQRDMRPPAAWQRALSAKLERLVVSAARPALGSVPANAEAVVFLDRSELLACLATDWCEGRVATRWWWQSLLRQGTASQIVKELWQSAPEYVPPALDRLAKAGKATAFVTTFSDAEARALLISVARSFSLNALVAVLWRVSGPHRPTPPRKRDANVTLPVPFTERSSAVRSTADIACVPPWDDWISKGETSSPGPERQSLLGIALMLQRAPTKVRAISFAREFEAWQSQTASECETPFHHFVADRKKDESGWQKPSLPRARAADIPDTSAPIKLEANSLAESSRESTPIGFTRSGAAQADKPGAQVPPTNLIDDGLTVALTSSEEQRTPQQQLQPSLERKSQATPRVEHEGTGGDLKNSVITLEPATNAPHQFPLLESGIATEFGGLFYLINLGIYLGLYGDFTTPREPGIELNIWDFVALVGRELVGERFQSDPFWTLLARLAAREDNDEPGRGIEPADEWRLPAEWLEPFAGEKIVRWFAVGERLRLFHSRGFLILDVPLNSANPVEQLNRELKKYEGLDFRVSSFELRHDSASDKEVETQNPKLETQNSKLETSPALSNWLDRLLPYFRARLRRALGLKETEDPASLLFQHRARVCVTGTHVDVFFDLAKLPVEIRFAGLDRDPGWVPAAGRFIAYHFE